MLKRSSVPVPKGRKDLDGPDDIFQLHEISTLLIQEGNLNSTRATFAPTGAQKVFRAKSSFQCDLERYPARGNLQLNVRFVPIADIPASMGAERRCSRRTT
jgi:hypothetical protein